MLSISLVYICCFQTVADSELFTLIYLTSLQAFFWFCFTNTFLHFWMHFVGTLSGNDARFLLHHVFEGERAKGRKEQRQGLSSALDFGTDSSDHLWAITEVGFFEEITAVVDHTSLSISRLAHMCKQISGIYCSSCFHVFYILQYVWLVIEYWLSSEEDLKWYQDRTER